LEDPLVVSDTTRLQESLDELEAAQTAIDVLYERWAELEAKVN
jgi:ATP-binding cassette subfamily F protein uup